METSWVTVTRLPAGPGPRCLHPEVPTRTESRESESIVTATGKSDSDRDIQESEPGCPRRGAPGPAPGPLRLAASPARTLHVNYILFTYSNIWTVGYI